MASPLLELFVKIAVQGDKEVDAFFKKYEKRAEALDKKFSELPKKTKKTSKQIADSMKPVEEATTRITEGQEKFAKSTDDAAKKADSNFKKILKGLVGIKDVTADLNKTGVNVKAELTGQKEVLSGLSSMKQAGDELTRGTITLTTDLKGGKEVLTELEGIEGVSTRIDGDRVTLTVDLDGGPETVTTLEAIETAIGRVDGNDINMNVNLDGGVEAVAELEAVEVVRDRLDGKDVDIPISVRGALKAVAEMEAVQEGSTLLSGALRQLSTLVLGSARNWPVLAAAIAGAALLFGPITALATGLVAGLGVLATTVGIAAGGFGLLAASVIPMVVALSDAGEGTKNLENLQLKLTAAQTKYNEAVAKYGENSKQALTALAAMESAQQKVNDAGNQQVTGIAHLIDSWNALKTAFNDAFVANEGVGEIMAELSAKVLDIATNAMPRLGETATNVAIAFEGAFNKVLDTLNGPIEQSSMAKFLDAMPGVVANITESLGNFSAGLLNFFAEAIGPAENLASWIRDISERFLEWTRSEEGRAQIQAFFATAAPIAKQLGESIAEIAKQLANVDPQDIKDAVQAVKELGSAVSTVLEDLHQISGTVSTAVGWINRLSGATDASGESMSSAEDDTSKWLGVLTPLGPRVLKIGQQVGEAFKGIETDSGSSLSATSRTTATEASKWETDLHKGARDARTGVDTEFSGVEEDTATNFGGVTTAIVSNLEEAGTNAETNAGMIRDKIVEAWEAVASGTEEKFAAAKDSVVGNLEEAHSEGTPEAEGLQEEATNAWTILEDETGVSFEQVKKYVVDSLTGAKDEGVPQADETNTKVSNAWDLLEEHTGLTWPKIKKWVVDNITGANQEAGSKADDAKTKVNNAWDLIEEHTGITWEDVKKSVSDAVSAIASNIRGSFSQAIDWAIQKMADLKSAAYDVLGFLGANNLKVSGGNTPVPAFTGDRTAGRSTRARGGVDDNAQPQGPYGGISDGLEPRVVYGEQKRRVKEAYIVEDREDNVPYLAEAASWHGYGLVKMAGGGITSQPSTQNITADGSSGGVDPAQAVEPVPVASPTASEQQPYTDAALQQYGMVPVPANPANIGDHVNHPVDAPSGDLGAASGGSLPSSWPSISMTAGPTASVSGWAKAGPSFAMAAGGLTGAPSSGAAAKPVDYQGVPVNWWDTFLSSQWTGDPAQDWPTLYPPSGWDPSTVFAPAAMRKGGILRKGLRYFQGGGLNQSQIDAGVSAGSSALGAPYSYGMAGDDGGYDCAGIWNWIESAVAYGAPQTGKRWGTYDAAAGSAGSFTTAGTTPGGVNIGVNLSGEGGYDDTHMAGDIGGTTFEANIPSGVFNGRGSDSFGTQYTMGGAGDMAQQVGTGESFDPAANMTQQVADWWGSASGESPSTTGTTPSGTGSTSPTSTNQQSNTQADITKVNNDTGQTSSSGGGGDTGDSEDSGTSGSSSGSGLNRGGGVGGNLRGSGHGGGGRGTGGGRGHRGSIPSRGKRKKSRRRKQRRYRRHHRMAGGGVLMDGVENFMANLPGVTQDYLTNVGLQTLGPLGGVSGSPLGTSTRDWVIAGLEAAGLDPTEEAIGMLESLISAESGGDPNAVSPDGAQGILQLMPETWDAYNVGGSVTDPVSNIAASIRYQLARYGQLVNFSPYAKGGMTTAPHLGMVGEAGQEVMLPLENRMVMSNLRAGLGTGDLEASIGVLAQHVDRVAERVDYQTDVAPERTGAAVGGGVDKRLVRNPKTRKAVIKSGDVEARRALHAGR